MSYTFLSLPPYRKKHLELKCKMKTFHTQDKFGNVFRVSIKNALQFANLIKKI